MDKDFWYQKWRGGQTGFHKADVNPLLIRYWNRVCANRSARVLVPLCGKSVDMVWLAAQGHRVVGAELSPVAVEAFFEEQGLDPRVRHRHGLEIWDSGDIRVYCGDIFELTSELVGRIGAVYDRAALIALPPEMRARYVAHIDRLLPPAGAPTLLVTLEYDQQQVAGPPFSVEAGEVRALYEDTRDIERLHEEDALGSSPRLREKGLVKLQQAVYRLSRRPT